MAWGRGEILRSKLLQIECPIKVSRELPRLFYEKEHSKKVCRREVCRHESDSSLVLASASRHVRSKYMFITSSVYNVL